ncbi:hypothetical protein GWI33_005942 [Rhynchophorus ferrugineus]|uniref:NR LBD domain-containing protein n=1 Tax=Rhynchophorus ferrugineus TaxID=354439 RepID=A0A834IW60_RHYFE|nr:hypothetical protein GWI33_005942 [Rhynchophorus ferrugineus]
MNVAAVQEERGPRKPKLLLRNMCDKLLPKIESLPFLQEHRLKSTQQTYEIMAHVFLSTIRQLRQNSGFGLLNRHSQNVILSHMWGPILVLRIAQSTIQLKNVSTFLQSTITYIRSMNIDILEQDLLENILLCRNDLLEEDKQASLAKCLQEMAIDALQIKNTENKKRFLNLLLTLPTLYRPSAEFIYLTYFKPIIGEVTIESIIVTI